MLKHPQWASKPAPKHLQAHQWLARACQQVPKIHHTIDHFGATRIDSYVDRLTAAESRRYQPYTDLTKSIHRRTKAVLGPAPCDPPSRDPAIMPYVLTANHHGIDYLAQSVQGSLIFALGQHTRNSAPVDIPILACGNIPLNNFTYPRGLLVYQHAAACDTAGPLKIPLFPDRLKRHMVSTVPGFTSAMLTRLQKRITQLQNTHWISRRMAETLLTVCEEDYGAPQVLALENYSQQAMAVNRRLWQRLFADRAAPNLLYVEIEKIVADLLVNDLNTADSLAAILMFDPAVCLKLLSTLDGVQGCWQRRVLAQRNCRLQSGAVAGNTHGSGTCFFWGIDRKGRRVPLYLTPSNQGTSHLFGVGDHGQTMTIDFTPTALVEQLHAGHLVPSLFTCYLVTGLARGVGCLGGYYQAQYLPRMQKGVVAALETVPQYHRVARLVAQVPTDLYLSGMQAVMFTTQQGGLLPAGPLEIIAAGGLTSSDLQKIRALTVGDAHIASLAETIPDLSAGQLIDKSWYARQASDCMTLLADKIVIK